VDNDTNSQIGSNVSTRLLWQVRYTGSIGPFIGNAMMQKVGLGGWLLVSNGESFVTEIRSAVTVLATASRGHAALYFCTFPVASTSAPLSSAVELVREHHIKSEVASKEAFVVFPRIHVKIDYSYILASSSVYYLFEEYLTPRLKCASGAESAGLGWARHD